MSAQTVTERVEGTRRIFEAEGWELTVGEEFATDEPLIADEVIARHLGVEVESIRRLIRRHAAVQTPDTASEVSGEPNITPVPYTRTVRRFTGKGQSRGSITVSGFMLTEADALFIVTRSDAPRAVTITKRVIAVYMAVRRHLAGTVPVEAHARRLPKGRSSKALPATTGAQTLEVELDPGLEFAMRRWARIHGYAADDPRCLQSVAGVWLNLMSSMTTVLSPVPR